MKARCDDQSVAAIEDQDGDRNPGDELNSVPAMVTEDEMPRNKPPSSAKQQEWSQAKVHSNMGTTNAPHRLSKYHVCGTPACAKVWITTDEISLIPPL